MTNWRIGEEKGINRVYDKNKSSGDLFHESSCAQLNSIIIQNVDVGNVSG